MNRLIDKLPNVSHPIDFSVRKRACFRVENQVGGKSGSCVWLDGDNDLIHAPILDDAAEAIRRIEWRIAVGQFFDED